MSKYVIRGNRMRTVKKRVSRYRKQVDRDRKRLLGMHDWMYSYWKGYWP